MTARPSYIYVLKDESGAIRYCGKALNPPKRLQQHLTRARDAGEGRVPMTHSLAWLLTLIARGVEPTQEVVETVKPGEDWRPAERAWIAKLKAEGNNLTNLAVGGEGPRWPRARGPWSPEHRANWLASMAANKAAREAGLPLPKKIKRKKPRAAISRGWTEAAKAKLSATLKAKMNTPEQKAIISARFKGNKFNLGRRHSDERKRALSEKMRGNTYKADWLRRQREINGPVDPVAALERKRAQWRERARRQAEKKRALRNERSSVVAA